ncbi:MAG TPA: hypothetical protein VFJ58_21345 [Armatimonadota bacterium]|nr:hypothetical protein [Armatimonadota bacterium]
MRMTRRRWLSGAAGIALATSQAAAEAGDSRRTPPSRLLIGYGVVNLWHTIDADELAAALSDAGCTLTEIEYVAWFNDAARKGESTVTSVGAARRFIEAMRRKRIKTLVSLINWNSAAAREEDDAWFSARVQEMKTTVGPDQVILLGVSEPDGQEDGKAYRWMKITAREWTGVLAANGNAGRGVPQVAGYDYVDWHHCSDFDDRSVRISTSGKPTINDTDCGPVLNPGPARVRAMAHVALHRRAHFHVYGFHDMAIDHAVIQALGNEIAQANSSHSAARRNRAYLP